jgi:hypothetical protein
MLPPLQQTTAQLLLPPLLLLLPTLATTKHRSFCWKLKRRVIPPFFLSEEYCY